MDTSKSDIFTLFILPGNQDYPAASEEHRVGVIGDSGGLQVVGPFIAQGIGVSVVC